MIAAPVTVVDRVSFTCSVFPEQAAAYCRRHPKLAGWTEDRTSCSLWIRVSPPDDGTDDLRIPTHADWADYSRRMAELCDALVALGCAERPSEILLGMGAEQTAADRLAELEDRMPVGCDLQRR